MPLEKMKRNLEKLIEHQKDLYKIAVEKTDIIIRNDIETLQTILKQENKHIQIIQKLEAEIFKLGKEISEKKGIIDANLTLSTMIEYFPNEQRECLYELKESLAAQLLSLQQRNQLNQDMLEQSLQFVNLSLDLLIPDMESFNYNPTVQDEQKEIHSLFDSKA
ncbi:flagellar protein FlgN [Bacillus sp. Bva_UNVM-123]|uniref:flagellar protein FlgN n=1 Tax=Bacillus sp. Bva_UNVM-123 TaxID=2829798 RepID=UPI00391F913D